MSSRLDTIALPKVVEYDAESVELTFGGEKFRASDFKVEFGAESGVFDHDGRARVPCREAVGVGYDEDENRVRSKLECRRCGRVWYGCKARRLDDEGRQAWGPVGVQCWTEEELPRAIPEEEEPMVPTVKIAVAEGSQGSPDGAPPLPALEFTQDDHRRMRHFSHLVKPVAATIVPAREDRVTGQVISCACGREFHWGPAASSIAALRAWVSDHFAHVEHRPEPGQVWEKREEATRPGTRKVLVVEDKLDSGWIVTVGTMRDADRDVADVRMRGGRGQPMQMSTIELVTNWRMRESAVRHVAGVDLARGHDASCIAIFKKEGGRSVLVGHGVAMHKNGEGYVVVQGDARSALDVIFDHDERDGELDLARALFDEELELEACGIAEGHLTVPCKFTTSSTLRLEGQEVVTTTGDPYQRPGADAHARRVLDVMWRNGTEQDGKGGRPEKRAECERRARAIVARLRGRP